MLFVVEMEKKMVVKKITDKKSVIFAFIGFGTGFDTKEIV